MKQSIVNGITVTFDPTNHSYRDNRNRLYKSVTSIIKQYEPQFDSEGNATRTALRTGRSKDEILAEWKNKGAESCRVGTRAHLIAESMFRNLPIPTDQEPKTPEESRTYEMIELAVNHLKSKWSFLIAEWLIFSPRFGIAGQCDLIMESIDNTTNQFTTHILDWKTCEKIETENKYNQFFLRSLNHLPCTKFNKYALQLRVYERLISDIGWKLATPNWNGKTSCAIVHVHHSLDKPRFIPVPEFEREVDIIMNEAEARFKK